MESAKQLDFTLTKRIAKRMTREALKYTIKDCWEACQMAEKIERAGLRTLKSGGYYRDEGSVYRAELARRRTA